jgi:hypothetical protein
MIEGVHQQPKRRGHYINAQILTLHAYELSVWKILAPAKAEPLKEPEQRWGNTMDPVEF